MIDSSAHPGPRSGTVLDRVRTAAGEAVSLEASIGENIRRILSTQQGSAPAMPDYGMPDLNGIEADGSRAAATIASRMVPIIERYEPRLTQVRVRVLDETDGPHDPLHVGLVIRGRVAAGVPPRKARYSVRLDAGGLIDVRPEERHD